MAHTKVYSDRKIYEWRRRVFAPTEINDLKIEFVYQFLKGAFYEADGKVILSDEDKERMKIIFNWLIGNEINIKENKGLFLTGDFGTGKSVILKGIIQFITKYYSDLNLFNGISQPVYVLSHEMNSYFSEGNEFMINRMKNTSILAIDDLGYESSSVRNYGTELKPFEEILMARYDKGKCILISTNKTLDEIGISYGWHIFDRIKQMTYNIQFTGQSKRK